ncbi:MAG: anti-sigma factor antagonist [Fibrobacter sp.]|nr:anti-sigma factor antagonist [Fibrobacter sp.]MBR2898881.1 anti-sigma factor antagonist [Fibrobacter sp.]MBR3852791.1 anti-sigma factor antagonist [Fibrobacter sp.]
MNSLKNYREVGIFDLLSAPLNPIGAFDAEQFKKDVRALIDANPDDKFVAVDLMGLDFVYSDAYNAFIQFQQELSSKGGMLALLSNSKTIADGLMKAGLASKLKVFSFEAEMMSFSLHSQSPEQESSASASEEPAVVAAVASQNIGGGAAPAKRTERKTGLNRRFTKSFNAIIKKKDNLENQGIKDPFEEPPTTHKVAPVIAVVLLIFAALAVFILM